MATAGTGDPASIANVSGRSQLATACWAVTAAFGAYFCMYAFRKPFTAATYADASSGLGYKTLLVNAQVIGYALSKLAGIKIVAETPRHRRVGRLLLLVALAHGALFGFAVLPRPWNALGLFLNGLALGLVFGMVIGFLEGRRMTEALSAGLCASFILADGVTKSLGAWLLELGVSPWWMPFTAGLLFLPPLGIFAAMLSRIPHPSPEDEAARATRRPMTSAQRRRFLQDHSGPLAAVLVMYLMVTVVRGFRADFQPELLGELNQSVTAGLFARIEIVVMLGVLAINGLAAAVRDNHRAFRVAIATCAVGLLLVSAALIAWHAGYLDGTGLLMLVGLGIYLPYVAVHTTLFERLLAMTGGQGNLGFLMYLADSMGYVGYVGVMLARSLAFPAGSLLTGFQSLCVACVVVSAVSLWVLSRTTSGYAAVAARPTIEELA